MDFNAQLRVMTAAIYYDLEKLPEFRRDMRIHLIGDRPLLYGKKDRMSVVGNTFVGSAPYFNAVCGSRFLSVRQLPAETLNKYAALPVWPKSGAIVFDKETQTAIVKLGTIPVNYHNKVVKVVPGVGIELTWQLNEDAVSYQIFRWTKQNQSDIKGLATVSEPIYVDKDVQPGVTYHYNVRGQRENGEFFPWGKAVSATIPE